MEDKARKAAGRKHRDRVHEGDDGELLQEKAEDVHARKVDRIVHVPADVHVPSHHQQDEGDDGDRQHSHHEAAHVITYKQTAAGERHAVHHPGGIRPVQIPEAGQRQRHRQKAVEQDRCRVDVPQDAAHKAVAVAFRTLGEDQGDGAADGLAGKNGTLNMKDFDNAVGTASFKAKK